MVNRTNQLVTQPFSAGYELVRGVEVHQFEKNEAVMDAEMHEKLVSHFGDPLIGLVGGLHYCFKPQNCVPAFSVAVPERNHNRANALLIQK